MLCMCTTVVHGHPMCERLCPNGGFRSAVERWFVVEIIHLQANCVRCNAPLKA